MNAVFTRSAAGHFRSSRRKQGAFIALQGGGVAGLLVADVKHLVEADQLGHVVSVMVSLYRSTGMGALHTEGERRGIGRGASNLEGSLMRDDGDKCVSGLATVAHEQAVAMPARPAFASGAMARCALAASKTVNPPHDTARHTVRFMNKMHTF